MRAMDLMDLSRWQPLIDAIAGRRCLVVANDLSGNWGDRMIDAGVAALLQAAGLQSIWMPESALQRRRLRPRTRAKIARSEVCLLWGSGSVGACAYPAAARRRHIVSVVRLPAILLPSGVWDAREDLSYCEAVCTRDAVSQAILRDAHRRVLCCPCLAECLPIAPAAVTSPRGVFLRADGESSAAATLAGSDPVGQAASLPEYLRLAGSCGHVATNRLHFALAAIAQGRRVTCLPTRWHKLRAYYDTWLRQRPLVDWSDRWPPQEILP